MKVFNGESGSFGRSLDKFANHLLFEYKKALLLFKNRKKLKQQRQGDVEWRRGNEMEYRSIQEYTTLEKSASNLRQVQRRFLSGALSSVLPTSPRLSCPTFSSFKSDTESVAILSDLPPNCLLMVASFLDGRSVFRLTTTCKTIRNTVLENPAMFRLHNKDTPRQLALQRHETAKFDISVQFNEVACRSDVVITPTNRSVNSNKFGSICGGSLSAVLPTNPAISVVARITFGNNISFADFHEELQKLYREGGLIPIELMFAGGDCMKGKYGAGCDLRCFSEASFIAYLRLFTPHLKSVHLQTSRLFKMTSSPPRILSTIGFLNEFGYVYERPALRFFFEDVKGIIDNWRHDLCAHSITLYIRQPKSFCHRYKELDPETVLLSSCGVLQQIVFAHNFIEDLKLTLFF